MTPRVLVLRAPGSNCDRETAFAFEQAGAKADLVHINQLLSQPQVIDGYQILCIPGGFSYGDDIAAGRILATQIRHHLSQALHQFKSDGKLILGICNGFQVLIKSGLLLPVGAEGTPTATLTWNDSARFEDRWVELRTTGERCEFLRGIGSMYLPIAHAEGKFVARDAETLQQLDVGGHLVLRYAGRTGPDGTLSFPANPNGSQADVAGVCDETGRVFGLMPHPERHIDPTQHPRWTRLQQRDHGDGLALFTNAVEFFR